MNRHTMYLAIAVLLMLTMTVVPAQSQITPPPPIVVNTPIVTINNSPGDQTDPHVDKDLASYTDFADNSIHYYRFSTNVDTAIPHGAGEADTLSDVSGGRICFTRQTASGDFEIAVFDTTTSSVTLVDPHPGDLRMGCAVGGNTLVYVDFGTGIGSGDIFFYDLAANPPVAPQAVSLSPNVEGSPNVSPDGNTIVWESCPTPSNCDVMQAVRSSGTWNLSTVANSSSFEENPDTEGTWVAYDSNQGGTNAHIYFQPVVGGQVLFLELPGVQVNPSVSGGFISFEGTVPPSFHPDVFVYNIAYNNLYQITSTANIDEQLNNISVLDNGDVRVVWTANDGDGLTPGNVYATTFTPITPVQPLSVLNTALVVTEFRRRTNSDALAAGATVQLSPSGSFNPATDSLALVVSGGTATVSISIPLSQFTAFGSSLIFSGVVNGIPTDAAIVPLGANKYAIAAAVGKQSLSGFANPATISITLGNNAGTSTTNAQILKL
jgi:hypothetical protein